MCSFWITLNCVKTAELFLKNVAIRLWFPLVSAYLGSISYT
jgi:hypothetical protein